MVAIASRLHVSSSGNMEAPLQQIYTRKSVTGHHKSLMRLHPMDFSHVYGMLNILAKSGLLHTMSSNWDQESFEVAGNSTTDMNTTSS